MKQKIVVETFNTSFFRLTYPFFAKGKVSKNYICLWGEINEFGILSTLKSEKKFSVLENFLYQRERIVSRHLMLKANQAMI